MQRQWALVPEQRAATDPDGRCLADPRLDLGNRDFARRVDAAAVLLRHNGIGPGNVVAVQLRNRIELVVVLFAAWRLGAAVTPMNPNLTDSESAHQLGDAGAAVVVTDRRPPAEFTGAVIDVADLPVDTDETLPDYDGQGTELALLIYTSGTTGAPKGVMLTHANLWAMCDSAAAALEITETDHCLLVLPLFHANAIIISTLTPLMVGARVTIAEKFHADTFFSLIEEVRPTYFSAVPTIYAMLDAMPDDAVLDTSSLRLAICGAAPMPAELIARIEERYGLALLEGYGLSEGTCVTTVNPIRGVRKPGTVGLPLPGQTVDIVSETGDFVPQGEVGEVLIAGPNIMAGYLGKPEATAEAIVDGRLKTGDLGYLDEDGYLVLVDRIKDMIIRGGENLYPKEIEAALYRHDDVLEAAVIASPDPLYGEVPVAYVALRPGSPLTVDDLFDVARQSLSKFKLPTEIRIVDGLPKNSVGKIDKPGLRRSHRSTDPVAPA